ncbi:MAG: AraD1 family protein [Dongiaceae bacterium]
MRLVQYKGRDGDRHVAEVEEGGRLRPLLGVATTYALAEAAIAEQTGLAEAAARRRGAALVDYEAVAAEGRLLPPVDHPEPARFWLTGTGLTHLGSADARDKMHNAAHGAEEEKLTDSMKIFRMGLEGGKPEEGGVGVQPEWFFKGLGNSLVPPGAPLPLPSYALAGAEEAEIVGLYLIGPEGRPYRLGYCLGNEFSDHVTEALNYLYLAHSKLRACSLGPELLVGPLPGDVRGVSRILRGNHVLWQQEFWSGEENMSHSLANLEHYHFRYPMFRRPGDLHAYFYGAAVLSCASGVKTAPGDIFEIDVPLFGRPLRNTMVAAPEEAVEIAAL